MIFNNKLLIIVLIVGSVWSCNKADDLGFNSMVSFQQPKHFPEPNYNFSLTPFSQATFELGKKLFYDGILSRDNSISCASCHIPENAFTHHGHDVSHGIDDQLGTRNALSLVNLAWSTSYFWDGGVQQLDLTPIVPIHNPIEMDETMENIVKKLSVSPEYSNGFQKAFGSKEITANKIMKSISHFMAALVSADTKYDKVKNNTATFTEEEQKGYQIFLSKCNTCHMEPLFTDNSFRDNGIGINPYKDFGRYEITQQDSDKLKFKVPTLRNLKYTAPYMHDGRFYDLKSVLRHYSKEIVITENLDPLFKESNGIPLADNEIESLLAFLNTLNDEDFINNKAFKQP